MHCLYCSMFAVVEMLQSLHSLQQENQRLQDQILGLTAKKERLQLLNTELALPFPPQAHSAHSSLLSSAQINFLSSSQGQSMYHLNVHLSNPLAHNSYERSLASSFHQCFLPIPPHR